MGHNIERGSEMIRNTSTSVAKVGLRTGRAALGGTYAPFVFLLGIEIDARGIKAKIIKPIPLLIPIAPGLILGGMTHDLNLAALVGAGGLYAEGIVISSIYEFLCPPDERSFKQKLKSFGRAVYAPGFTRFLRNSRRV